MIILHNKELERCMFYSRGCFPAVLILQIQSTHTHTSIFSTPTLTPISIYPHSPPHRHILASLAHTHSHTHTPTLTGVYSLRSHTPVRTHVSGYFAAVRRHKSRPEMARFPRCCLFSSGAPRPAHCSERLRHPVSRHHRPPTLARAHLNIDTFKIIHLHNTYQHPHGNSTTQ